MLTPTSVLGSDSFSSTPPAYNRFFPAKCWDWMNEGWTFSLRPPGGKTRPSCGCIAVVRSERPYGGASEMYGILGGGSVEQSALETRALRLDRIWWSVISKHYLYDRLIFQLFDAFWKVLFGGEIGVRCQVSRNALFHCVSFLDIYMYWGSAVCLHVHYRFKRLGRKFWRCTAFCYVLLALATFVAITPGLLIPFLFLVMKKVLFLSPRVVEDKYAYI